MIVAWFYAMFGWLCLRLFLWSGSWLWPIIDIYAPDGEDEPPRAMIFARDNATLDSILRGQTDPDA